jgi:hypothetical protein
MARPALCDRTPRVTIVDNDDPGDGQGDEELGELTITGDVYGSGDPHDRSSQRQAAVGWRGDFDGDGRPDLIVHVLGSCGTGGCETGVFIDCGRRRYAVALYQYVADIEPARSRTRGWRDLIISEKVERLAPDGSLEKDLETRLHGFEQRFRPR